MKVRIKTIKDTRTPPRELVMNIADRQMNSMTNRIQHVLVGFRPEDDAALSSIRSCHGGRLFLTAAINDTSQTAEHEPT